MIKTSGAIVAMLAAMLGAANASAQANYLVGTVDDTSSYAGGILFRVTTRTAPTLCQGATGAFLVINAAMISHFLASYYSGSRTATIYVDGLSNDGYCHVTAYDPNQ